MKARSSIEHHASENASRTWETIVASIGRWNIPSTVFLVFSHVCQHVGGHERDAIDVFFWLQDSFGLGWARRTVYFPQ
jgi:hypothetical protein